MNDEIRLHTLTEYDILDSVPEREFDDIVELASAFFQTPISLISILDSHRQWFKAKVGLEAAETPIEYAFCYHAIEHPDEVMVVTDSFQDSRFQNNPLAIGSPHVRFYAGAPIVTDEGVALGTLCVIDNQPRTFSKEQQRILQILAKKVIQRLELRKQYLRAQRQIDESNRKLAFTFSRLLEAERLAQIGYWSLDENSGDIFWSPEMYRLFGKSESTAPISLSEWINLMESDDRMKFQNVVNKKDDKDPAFTLELRTAPENGDEKWLLVQGLSEKTNSGSDLIKGTMINITERKIAEKNKEQYIASLEEMLYALSHKIRKPVTNVIGLAKELSKVGGINADSAQYLKAAADELDGYIHEFNDLIYQKKIKLNQNRKG